MLALSHFGKGFRRLIQPVGRTGMGTHPGLDQLREGGVGTSSADHAVRCSGIGDAQRRGGSDEVQVSRDGADGFGGHQYPHGKWAVQRGAQTPIANLKVAHART
jgi:hypothetical protein